VNEKELLGTAGTLRQNLDFFGDEDGLLIHVDNYCLADFNDFAEAHKRRPQSCLMTMMTFTTDQPESCGIVETDDRHILVNFLEKVKDPPSNEANGAIYALSRDLLRTIHADFAHASDFSTEVIPLILNKIYTYHTNDVLVDIGSPEQYQKAQCL
jgi:mannose-1-phosphate guanylyltransferase